MKYILGINIFSDNIDNTYATLSSILKSINLPKNAVQINVAWNEDISKDVEKCNVSYDEEIYDQQNIDAGNLNYNAEYELVDKTNGITQEEFVKFALSNGVKFYYLDNEDNIINTLVENTDAEYIHFTKSGMLYNENVFKKLYNTLNNRIVKAITVKTSARNSSPRYDERKSYVSNVKFGGYLDYNKATYHLVHYDFYTYFLKKSLFTKEALGCVTPRLQWALNLAKMYHLLLTNQPVINPIDGNIQQSLDCRDAFDWQLLKTREQFADFIQCFLEPIVEWTFDEKVCCPNNAKYNVMYYIKQISIFHPDEEDVIAQIRAYVEKIIGQFENREIIINNRYLDRVQKQYLINKFDNWENELYADVDAINAEVEDVIADEKQDNMMFTVEMTANNLKIEGRCAMGGSEPYDVYLDVDGEEIKCDVKDYYQEKEWFDVAIARTEFYTCDIMLEAGKEYHIGVVCKKGKEIARKTNMTFSRYMPLHYNLETFYEKEGWLLYSDEGRTQMVVVPNTKKNKSERVAVRNASFEKGGKAGKKAILARKMYAFLNATTKKKIWLVSDRTTRGDDNGECFFRYLKDNKPKNVKAYFVIDKNCDDYKRMKQYGKVIPVFSWRHKMYHLMSEYVISSQANDPVINPFKNFRGYYQDIMADRKLAFLQHGVIKDDLSGWLNKYNRNLYGFVTTTKGEYKSILDYEYYYEPKEVWLTGLPRHDYLYNDEKKYITIMPTWRKTLTAGTNEKGEWILGEDFKESGFFKFYDDLLNDERLLATAKKLGYKICFFPHPNVKSALHMFRHDEDVIFFDLDKPYREVYAESNLIMTDYSSAVFDFAYLRKPVVYCQFDRDTFFSGGHSYVEGYYDYQTDGFGEVEIDLESAVTRLIEYMENGCVIKDEYRKRIDEAFAYADKDCCKRVVDKLENRENYFPDEAGK